MQAKKYRCGKRFFIVLQVVLALVCGTLPVKAYDAFNAHLKIDVTKTLLSASSKSRSTISPLAASGWKKLQSGDVKGAWQDFTNAIAQNPSDPEARAGRAAINLNRGDYNSACADANYGVFADSDNLQARWIRGLVNFDINNFIDARDDLKFVVNANPDSAGAHEYLAETYRCLGDRKNSYSEYITAARLNGANNPKRAETCTYLAKVVNPSPGGRDSVLPPPMIVENLAAMYKASPKIENGRALFAPSVKWPVGKTITVAFNGDDPVLFEKIAEIAPEWSKYGNIKFDFKDPATGEFRKWSPSDTTYSADIRIGFENDGYWSVIGKQSVTVVPPNHKSMNFDPFEWQHLGDSFSGTILHEFGHALGFLHEHQHPFAGGMTEIRWQDDYGYVPTFDNSDTYMADSAGRQPGLLSYYAYTQGWSPSKSYSQIATYEDTDALALGPLDTKSIMQYAQTPFLLRTGKASPAFANENVILSPGDKIAIQKHYPGPTSLSGGQ